MTLDLGGVFPPLVTPFTEDGSLDLAGFEANLESYAAEELAGYLVLGSNGEAGSLEEAEKLSLVRAARARSAGRTLLVGTGLESTRATIALTRRVAGLGADAALVLTPCYYKSQMTVDVLRRHFESVAEASPIPVLLYSVPQFTGIPFPVALAEALASHTRIAGMKESSGDVGLLGRIVAAVPPGFRVLCGSAPVFYPALCQGAVGGILAAACCAPRAVSGLHRAFRQGDHTRALALQRALTPLAAAITTTHGVPGLKMAVDESGRRGGAPRAPLRPAPESFRGEVRRMLDAIEAAAG
jgi:4-hydroxy-2-oxoglutarate aldolase